MIFFAEHNVSDILEEEEEEEEIGEALDDAILEELDADDLDDEALLVELDPLLKADVFETLVDGNDEGTAEDPAKIFEEEEEDDEDMDYDSFDDHDEM
jgi:hypothetical protein